MAPPHQRRKRRRRRSRAVGAAPGTLTIDGSAPKPVLWLFAYGPEHVEEKRSASIDDVKSLRGKFPVLWLNVDGLGDGEILKKIGDIIGLHPLALEDVVNVHQRPKAEEYGPYEFIVVRTVEAVDPTVESEQISVVLGNDFVVTFQERAGDCFEGIRARIRNKQGKLRSAGADYLAYAIIDSILDNYFPILETLADRLEAIEDKILAGQVHGDAITRVYEILQDLRRVRQAVLPLRDVLSDLSREPNPHIREETRIYLRDAYDHTRQLFDQLDAHRETSVALMDLHLARVNQRMNEVIKVLTIISTIFIPLSFVAGIYGMNFDPEYSPLNMPEVRWYYGYPVALAIMAVVAGSLLYWFRRKGWLGERTSLPREESHGPPPDKHG